MRRPWYNYLLLLAGGIGLLVVLFSPTVAATSTDPGGLLLGHGDGLFVRPGSPLSRAGVTYRDLFVDSDVVERPRSDADGELWLRWKQGIPRRGSVSVLRDGRVLTVAIHPVAPAWPVRLAWSLIGLLNLGLVILALALFWQRPRDSAAVLLGLVLLFAPVFWFPREPRVLALALAAHFFTIFPPLEQSQYGCRPRLTRFAALYGPLLFCFMIAGGMLKRGGGIPAAILFNGLSVVYAGYNLQRVLRRARTLPPESRPLSRTLTVVAGAILAAVLMGISQRWWAVSGQVLPVNLVPAVLFSAAVGHLVFRLRALEVQVVARRTLQYLLTRWTLGTLFLIPGFLLVWRMGQATGAHERTEGGVVLFYLVWMLLTAILLNKRQEVLRNLDRRFFRDVEATRQALIQLAQDLGGRTDAAAVLSTLEDGVRGALHPKRLRFALPDVREGTPAALTVPLRRGAEVQGYLLLGEKESGEPYSSEERQLLEAAAVQAAVALENARLNGVLLARQREELAARTAGILAGAEEERRRLAADLHDQVLPELRQIATEVERLKNRSNGLAPDLDRLEQEIRGTMDGVREVMEALRPSALDMLGLTDALESYFRKGAARSDPPITVSVRRPPEEPELSAEESLGLYRICQEAINNVLKHSGAGRGGLEVQSREGQLVLSIWDDGRGLDIDRTTGLGHGLGNMRHRAELIGAEVRWERPEGGGTRVVVALPREV